MAAELDDLVVIFNPTSHVSSEGGLILVTNFVIFPIGILSQDVCPGFHSGVTKLAVLPRL